MKILVLVSVLAGLLFAEDMPFGENKELLRLLYNKSDISKNYLEKRKTRYLENAVSKYEFNGLFLKGSSAKNFDQDKMDYNVRLEWNLFDGGYMEAKKDVRKKRLEYDLEYEEIINDIAKANLELSLYKMNAISNYINYHFLKLQKALLFQTFKRDRKKFKSSLITATKFYKSKKAYEQISHKVSYYGALEKELYDYKLKPFISDIENIKIADKNSLLKESFYNSFALKRNKIKIKKSYVSKEWGDRFKANIYVENKKHFFLEEADMIAGVGVQIPLDFYVDKNEPQKVEIRANRLNRKVIKNLIKKNIEEIYHKVNLYKANIETLKSDMLFFQKEIQALKIKSKYPLQNQRVDINDELTNLKLLLSQHKQGIWQQRTEILKLLLQMQNISGVRVLAI